MVKQIAAEEEIPAHFLAKILQQLARKGLLRSSKGPTGGFLLRVPPDEVRLLDIVEALDGLSEYEKCASGLAECSDRPSAARFVETAAIAYHGLSGAQYDCGPGEGARAEATDDREAPDEASPGQEIELNLLKIKPSEES